MFYWVFIFLLLQTSCHSLQSLKKNPSAEELFQHAQQLKERGYYKDALSYLKQFKSRFLYSQKIKLVDLAMADIYFEQKEWTQAVRAYSQFFELYPNHSESDRALFRTGLCYFYQLPSTADRDLSLSKKTLFHINRHLKTFPKSPYKKQSEEYKQKTLTLLAQKEWMTARFHLKQNTPLSAQPYLAKLKKDYLFLLPKTEKEELETSLPTLKTLKKIEKELKQNKEKP